MENGLKFISVVLILCGIIGFVYVFSDIDWRQYDIARSLAKSLPENELAQSRYEAEKAKVFPLIVIGIITLFTGLVSGLVLYALAVIIESLRSIDRKLIYSQDASAFLNQ